MRILHIILLSILSTLAGIAFLAYEHEWIIIRSPWNASAHYSAPGVSKQKITLWYWNQNQFKQETKELIIADDVEKKAATIIANWLTHLHDEKIIKNKITLQSALLDPAGTHLYISFDQSIFDKQQSTHEKWMLLEGLLRTLRENGIKLQGVYFLVNHAVMMDEHLEFGNAWKA